MKKIILFLVVVGLGFLGWKMYSSKSVPEDTSKKVEVSNTVPANEPSAPEVSNTAETSVRVLPAPQQ